jgi:hypothetical protein
MCKIGKIVFYRIDTWSTIIVEVGTFGPGMKKFSFQMRDKMFVKQ